jgi:hypothetical protein
MDEICHLGIFSNDQLFDINACHLHLQVTTLSDITDGSGMFIITEAIDGALLVDWFSPLKWPRQPVATNSQQNLWKHAIEAAYTLDGCILRTPLGAWVSPPTMIWHNFYDIQTKQVITLTPTISLDGHCFTKHVIVSCTWHHCKAFAVTSVPVIPDLTSLD